MSSKDMAKTEGEEAKKSRPAGEADRIKELRERLYSRGAAPVQSIRHSLSQVKQEPRAIHETLEEPKVVQASVREVVKETSPQLGGGEIKAPTPTPATMDLPYNNDDMTYARRRSFRKKLALVGVLFFIGAVAVSAFLMFTGNNTISGENISLSVNGPIAVGGGEEIPFTVTIANQNTVAIQSATLIIEYPRGTQSVTEKNKEIMIERKQLDTIGAGELITAELRARIFGEENEEQEIKVSVDYRVAGSNAIFHKEAEPLRFKVSTSPVVMTFDTVKSISSGQELEIKLNVQSNSPSPLTDILIKTEYPDGFDFSESNPETISGEDTWKISSLKPGEKKSITIRGLMTGYEDETREFNASAGVSEGSDKNKLSSTLAQARTQINIEKPFFDVGVTVNGSSAEEVVMNTSEIANVEVRFKNTLDTALYNGKISVELGGNALNEFQVKSTDGFYDSSKNTIVWDSVDEDTLKEVLPGRTSNVSFTLDPKDDIGRAPEITILVTVEGERIFEDRVPQKLVGTAGRTLRVESIPVIASTVLHTEGPFTNSGPIPPVAEEVTQYTYTLKVTTGANDVTGAEVSAVVPSYVQWLDLVTADDAVTYTPSTRTLKWSIGDMKANSSAEMSTQVSFLPSLSQVNTSPTLLETQRFKATDRFTGTVVRTEHPALTTNLIDEEDEDDRDGKVRTKE